MGYYSHFSRWIRDTGTVERLPFDDGDLPVSFSDAMRLVNTWNKQSIEHGPIRGRFVYFLED